MEIRGGAMLCTAKLYPMWHRYFQRTGLVNLPHRKDRLEESTKILNNYNIPFEVIIAILNKEAPCVGLVHTMQKFFQQCLRDGLERCLLFEDDISPLVSLDLLNHTMDAVVSNLPVGWDQIFLGCNPAGGFERFLSPNILKLRFGYNTHAVAYSKRIMEIIANTQISEPVDNYSVRCLQPKSLILATYPILFTQKPGFSDIGGQHTDWSEMIEKRFEQQVKLIV